jgi:methyl-accepting chemotaxis protein
VNERPRLAATAAPHSKELAMTRMLQRTLILAILVIALPTAGFAQPAGSDPADSLSAQDREVLAAAEQLATESGQMLEQWITTQAITLDRLFARLYFPIAKTSPQKYSTPYDALADRDLVRLEDKALARATTLQYAIVTDSNAYIPAHNSRFAQPMTGNAAHDYINNRSKRMLGDAASFAAARNEARYLLQRTRLETGDVIYDLSVPITLRGKHWGCARIGFRRND